MESGGASCIWQGTVTDFIDAARYRGSMLQIRLEGDPDEARAFMDALAAAGCEVQIGTVRNRGDFAHLYGVVRLPDWRPPATPAQATIAPPVRAPWSRRAIEGRRRP